MTRHREAATLFAGADDFTDRRTGRLVDHGAAPYENKPENRASYFATLENDKGERHTIWGVDLERAIASSGAKRGDRIGLEHGGSETVRLPDGTTAERNTWHVRGAAELAAGKLAQVLGRERPKESTLDFADRRGFDGESVVRRWLERGRAKVSALAGKMRDALRRNLERHGRPDLMPATDIAGTPTMQRPPPQIEQPAAPQRPQAERAAPDPLAGFRAGIERAEAAGGGLALDVARAQLAVAQEFQAVGKDPRHHSAAIMQEGQQRAFAGLAQPSQVKTEPERPAAVQVSEQDRRKAEAHAKMEVGQFKALAVKRQAGFAGYTDRNPSAWRELPGELRERIERFNAMPKERQAVELDKMQRELSDRYARDPQEITRSRQRQREQERGRDGGRGY
jgi:hypothetical protein